MEIDQKIMDLKLIISEKEKLDRKLNVANKEFNELKAKENELKTILEKEEKDVKRLENVSLTSIWFSLIGSKNEKLWKEKEEFSNAEYNYKAVFNTLNQLENEISSLKKKLKEIKSKEYELEDLLRQKETQIIEGSSELGEKLKDINNNIHVYRSQAKELKEAINAGNVLVNSLKECLNSLNKAKNWGTYDLFGGGFLADMAKHSHLNDAKSSIENLKYQANKFTRELRDVNITLNLNINISDSLKFADWFFDGIFVDYTVQSRIKESIYQVESQLNNVTGIISRLNSRLTENERRINTLKNEKKGLL